MIRIRLSAAASLAAAVLIPLVVTTTASPALARDSSITSFDGTQLIVHFFPTANLTNGRAPTVLLAHGYGEAGPATPDAARLAGAPQVSSLLAAGYNVTTWDARGHGGSGGTARFDSPDFEVKDTQAVIDWITTQPEAQLDGPGDPRLGMTGASYGGIIQYLTAALDRRVDVITPAYTAYSLPDTTMTRYGKFKEGWGLALSGIGAGTIPSGLASPLGPQLHGLDPETISGISGSIAAGTITPAFRTYLEKRSPSTYLSQIKIPTLVQGGTSDTLFPLINAVSDYTLLKAAGVPVKMVWNCEGHSLCAGDAGPLVATFEHNVINWFDRWLKKNPSVSTAPGFSWIADNETVYRSAPTYPAPVSRYLVGRLAPGQLSLLPVTPASPAFSLGLPLVGAQPAAVAVNVPITPPSTAGNVVGFPKLTLTYSGLGAPNQTWIYAQILDNLTHRVVGLQVTPVPVLLDGASHTVSLDLEAIATRATPGSKYQLQLMGGSLIYGLQRTTGTITFSSVTVSLPVINAG